MRGAPDEEGYLRFCHNIFNLPGPIALFLSVSTPYWVVLSDSVHGAIMLCARD